jgi:hypothetical protein
MKDFPGVKVNRVLDNRFYNFLFLAITLFSTLAYVWMGSRMTAQRLTLPGSVSILKVAEKNHEISFEVAMREHALFLTGILHELSTFHNSISLIGGLAHPVEVVVNFEEPDRYLVTETRVELGQKWLEQGGQLQKALTKSWVLQMARADVSGSLLRTEVASDLLWAMLSGNFDLEKLDLPQVSHWMLFASSFATNCKSAWSSLELNALCNGQDVASSDAIQSIGFRPLLDAMVWDVYNQLPMFKRIEFIRAWTAWVTKPPPQPEMPRPESVDEWRSWLRTEFANVMPPELDEIDPAIRTQVNESLVTAGLEGPRSLDVQILFRSLGAEFADTEKLAALIASGNQQRMKHPVVALTQTSDGWFTLPGRARLPNAGTAFFNVKEVVWEACQAPGLKELISDNVHSEKLLFVQTCGKSWQALYAPLISGGVPGFAAENPNLAFAMLQKPSVELAARQGMMPEQSLLKDLLEKSDQLGRVSPHIGLQEAHWRADVRAYQVLGAVEAVEWFRSSKDL